MSDEEINNIFRAFCEVPEPGETFKDSSRRALEATRRMTGLSEQAIKEAVSRQLKANMPALLSELDDIKKRLED